MKRFLTCGKTSRLNLTRFLLISSVVGLLAAGCTRAELEDKAGAYNQAIGESNNRQILANAVRASQRGPMSFVGFGEMAATPTFSGGATGSWMFDAIGTVTGSTLGTSVSAGGGFNSFQLSNLNNTEFMTKMQEHVGQDLIQHFTDLNYPPEIVKLVFVQEYRRIPIAEYYRIVHEAESKCARSPSIQLSIQLCEQIAKDREASREHGCPPDERGPTITIPNSGRHFCSMNRFQTFVRQLRLLNLEIPLRYVVGRTPEGMLYWLGELIAAQNYSVDPYIPQTFANTHTPLGYTLVPLFEVHRGPPLLPPAVAIVHHGEIFYIPRPAFGTIDEARSLEVLDLVWYAIALKTGKDQLPKSTTVTLAPVR
jgi:hypothetical protein